MNLQLFHRRGTLRDPVSVPRGSRFIDSYITPLPHMNCRYDLTFVGDLDLPADENEAYEIYTPTQNVPIKHPMDQLEYLGKFSTGVPNSNTGILWRYLFHVKPLVDLPMEAQIDTHLTKLKAKFSGSKRANKDHPPHPKPTARSEALSELVP